MAEKKNELMRFIFHYRNYTYLVKGSNNICVSLPRSSFNKMLFQVNLKAPSAAGTILDRTYLAPPSGLWVANICIKSV